ncbi:MAG TPA: GGDEF domain-containing protein, partial [Candidatus Edwardsbacteria bacterium]|nr:GGDEF domain-containing protein [Candidatus Edwardsbacteria bacterium]
MSDELEFRDDLSGLYNRRYFGQTLPRLLKEAQTARRPLSLVVIDIDFFKTINDTYGHACGDRVIREFGEFLLRTVKKSDIVCRYGGDEFVCILPRTDYGQSLRVSQRIIEESHQREFGRLKITLSIGIATYPDHGDDGLTLFESADQDLYSAKRHGRDQVGLHSEREPGLLIPTPE